MTANQIKNYFKDYFNLSKYLDDEQGARQSIIDGVTFRGPNIVILIIAIFIASLGLNTNSAAVIIGAMLISPLMGPIIGIGLGVGTYDFALIKRAARNLAMAAGFSVIASTLYFLISPVSEGHSELLARTSPTIYDVLIGFFGGGAGIVAIACRQKGNVIPGVAIATALMPPLCTAGYGLATWQMQYFTGAFYLFIINCIFIAFATIVGVKLFKFHTVNFVNEKNQKKVQRIVMAIVVLTVLPSIYLTTLMIRDSYFSIDANAFIETEIKFPNTQVFSKNIYTKGWQKYIDISLIGERLNTDSLQLALTAKMNESSMLKGTHLKITQGLTIGSVASQSSDWGDGQLQPVFQTVIARLDRQSATIDSLKNVIVNYENLDSLSYTIAPEIHVLFPQVRYIALNTTYFCSTENRGIDTVNVALVDLDRPIPDNERFREYLSTRTGLRNMHIIPTKLPNQ